MTKRLTLVGLLAVAVFWGPWVYAELVREPLPAAPAEPRLTPVVEPTPVAFEHARPPQPEPQLPAAANEPEAEEPVAVHAAEPVEPEAAHEPAAAAHEVEVAKPTVAEPAEPAKANAGESETAKAAVAEKDKEAREAETAKAVVADKDKDKGNDNDNDKDKDKDNDRDKGKEAHEAEPAKRAERETSPAEIAATAQALAPAFRSTFDHEARDAQWAEDQEPRLSQLMSKAGVPANAITEVRCQSTVCRISFNPTSLEQASPAALAQLMQRVHEEFGTSLGLDLTKPEGAEHAAFYLLRKGAELKRGRDSM